jgi:hypothetical protein
LFVGVEALHAGLVEKEPSDFISHYIFEPVPFAFGGDLGLWITWKTTLATLLDVDPYDIVLTGSAAIGYSLNLHKGFRPFGADSDIDCGVVSPYHFESAWRYLRQLRPSWLSLPAASRRAITAHRTNYVFAGTIATDSILGLLPFGGSWQSALDRMARIAPTEGREVRLRIYRDYDSLRYYQAIAIERLRNVLLSAIEPDSEIPIEDKPHDPSG